MEKKIAACVLLYEPVTQSFLVEHPTGRRWYKKGTKEPETGVFSFPKGCIEEGEQPVEAAIREIKEECDIDLERDRLHYLGHYEYIRYKSLEMFLYPIKPNEIDPKKCRCNSFFEKDGKQLPEVNGFAFISMFSEEKKYLLYSQQCVFDKILKDFPEFFS